MPYTVICDGRAQVRHLAGPRSFLELLTREELERVRRGELVGISSRGALLDLSSPLEDGAEVTLRPLDPARDLAAIGVPVTERGDLAGLVDILAQQQARNSRTKTR